MDNLSGSAMSVISQLIASVFDSIKAKKATFMMREDEITLCSSTKVFATLNIESEIDVRKASAKYPLITSSMYNLPADLLSQFRTVCLSKPDTESILRMYLIIHGFSLFDELARKLVAVYSIWTELTFVGSMPSLRALYSLISDAGDHLDKRKAMRLALLSTDDAEQPGTTQEQEACVNLPAEAESASDIKSSNEIIAPGLLPYFHFQFSTHKATCVTLFKPGVPDDSTMTFESYCNQRRIIHNF